ncbi:MAG: translation initiation factor IF-2 [Phycisphaerales bacterium]|nr:translation initiation factor IF-2 [Phycisphaerales bacterium]MCB9856381.1 translation initiation factor IF-2 [Phycisphaerales bacterium]MCB9864053.1 translation initiation factor IF-2 [Phycisphaerales bacterium]
MAEKKQRIHTLAKELDVTSKAIITKCTAEGIEIKNHMHVVSAGLEATIREWFSEGAHNTTHEESARVNLKKVKRKKKPKAVEEPTQPDAEPSAVEAETPAPVETPSPSVEAEPPAVAAEAPALVKEAGESTITEIETVAAPTIEQAPAESLKVAAEAPAETVEAAAVAPVEPAPPEVVEPKEEAPPVIAGPQNIPKPAALKGPNLVRIDRPERVEAPRPAARSSFRSGGGRSGPPPAAEMEEEGRRGGRAPARGGASGRVPEAKDASNRSPRHKRGGRDDRDKSEELFKEWRERGVEEMRERIARAQGRGIGGIRAVDRPSSRRGKGPTPITKKEAVVVTEPITIRDLSRESGIQVLAIIRKLREEFGVNANPNGSITADQAQMVCLDYGIELSVIEAKTMLDEVAEEFAAIERKNLASRPPIVTVLGHVDHGKTSLLDRIRKTKVAAGEAGGITQHVGAYQVKVDDKIVTFLDTPGHAAFTAMRARGAHMTDVVVLVVAADDGIMPTTLEAINHAKAADTTIVVALNKIDLNHDINKLYGQLSEHGLTPSGDWGGETDVVKTSATTGQGIDELLAHLATLSEVLDLKADPTIPAMGTVIEARRDEKVGVVATVMVQEGTLKTGATIVCGPGHGRIRSMKDDKGKELKKAGPATPVVLMGLSDVPEAGDKFYVMKSARRAKDIAEEAGKRRREKELVAVSKPTTLESIFATAAEGKIPELNVIIRADAQGSIDALRQELSNFQSNEVRLSILHAGVGTVTESDITLAKASNAIIIAFYIAPDPAITRMADHAGVDIRSYRVLYEVSDEIKAALEGLLTPDKKIESRGMAEVREIFHISKVGKVAGCYIRDGVFNRNYKVRVVRDGVVVVDSAELDSLRRFKDDVKEVKSGFECGIRIEKFDDVKPGDVIEAFEVIEIARTLEMSQ